MIRTEGNVTNGPRVVPALEGNGALTQMIGLLDLIGSEITEERVELRGDGPGC